MHKEVITLVLTYSTMLSLGTTAPDFSLPDVITGNQISIATFAAKKLLMVMFICKHCPYVQHIKPELTRLANDYEKKDIGIVGISSNDAKSYPDDSPFSLKQFAQELKLKFPICYDETQVVAKAYTAACTPDFFLFDKERKLIYRGQFDDSRPGNNEPLNGHDLRSAIDAALLDQAVSSSQKPSVGCNIKWQPGNEPKYFSG